MGNKCSALMCDNCCSGDADNVNIEDDNELKGILSLDGSSQFNSVNKLKSRQSFDSVVATRPVKKKKTKKSKKAKQIKAFHSKFVEMVLQHKQNIIENKDQLTELLHTEDLFIKDHLDKIW